MGVSYRNGMLKGVAAVFETPDFSPLSDDITHSARCRNLEPNGGRTVYVRIYVCMFINVIWHTLYCFLVARGVAGSGVPETLIGDIGIQRDVPETIA